jgi:acyl-CoA thioesterase II
MSGSDLNELLLLRQTGKDEFETAFFPIRMGNSSSIAYGGCALGVAAAAARRTVKPEYHAYSLLGNFLGPALTDRNVQCRVRRLRDTRTFATRHVEVSQVQDDGSRRLCLFMTLDFQTKEASVLMRFSVAPTLGFKSWREESSPSAMRQEFANLGKIDAKMAKIHEVSMKVHEALFEQRNCASGFSAQTLNGIGKHLPTDQDQLSLTERSSQQWVKAGTKISEEEQLGALILFMDGALSFVPLMHNHQYLDDAGACSSLDFAMRLFDNEVDFNQWHLHEMKTVAGAEGRTFSEARLYNEQGKLVANMTQQSIMRPPPTTKSKASL